jgi:hypothetical protein
MIDKPVSPPLPAALGRRRDGRLLHRPRRQRAGARLRVLRGGAGAAAKLLTRNDLLAPM